MSQRIQITVHGLTGQKGNSVVYGRITPFSFGAEESKKNRLKSVAEDA